MSHTEELILEVIPPIDVAEKLSNVKEVVVLCAQCFGISISSDPNPDIGPFLAILAKAHNIIPLHVRAYLTSKRECLDVFSLTRNGRSTFDLITYEFFNVAVHSFRYSTLWMAFKLRSIAHLSDSWHSYHKVSGDGFETITGLIGSELMDAFCESSETITRPFITGRLYLCDIPELILTPQEVNATINIEEAAMRKLYTNLNRPLMGPLLGQTKPSWKDFNTMIKLVKSGFRPSFADLTEGRT